MKFRSMIFNYTIGILRPNPCPAICGEVASAGELPDPPVGCEFIKEKNIRPSTFMLRLWEYHEGLGWHSHAEVSGEFTDGSIISLNLNLIDGWYAVINDIRYPSSQTVEFDPPVLGADVTFANLVGCNYIMQRITPP